MLQHVRGPVSRLAFVLVVGSATVIASERMFWYWSTSLPDHVLIAGFYALGAAICLWLVDRYRVDSWWPLLLAAPIQGYIIEGVITPIMYTGGPFAPIFPAYFAFWHGLGGLVVMVFWLRRELLRGATRRVGAAAAGIGVVWGAWSITLPLPENLEDPELLADGPLSVLDPLGFVGYAVTFTAVLAATHLLLGMVWQPAFRPSRAERWLWVALVGVVVVAWNFVVPWALPMFAAYGAVQIWALRRHRSAVGETPSLLEQLRGRLPLRSLLALAPMAVTASAVYGGLWALDLPDSAIRTWMWVQVAIHVAVGGVLSGWALWRVARRRPDATTTSSVADGPTSVHVS